VREYGIDMPKRSDIKKVLLIGSGPIQIGQAAEFDYSGSQACKVLKEEGISVVLINSNPATIMTDPDMGDKIYIEPIDADIISKIIEKERPDGLIAGFGGQTALNVSAELKERGIIDKYGIKFLGTSFDSILNTEDRNRFKNLMMQIKEPIPKSKAINSIEEAIAASESLGFPIIIRPAYTLGGTGGGIANNLKELKSIVRGGLNKSRIHQVLLEESIGGWKEIEYEVIRDAKDTCITVCNMENIDPIGIHTGESIVVAPSQTLTDMEYQMLRTASLKIIRALKVEGGCNIQFALKNGEYRVIEVNPRVSRSSALASKATGYPIARVAAKIAIGLNLDEIQNDVTKTTFASFEPAMDYIAVKIPRWPFDKFPQADNRLTTHMKSTGETMAIGRTFESALMKALRSLDIFENILTEYSKEDAERHISLPTNERIFAIFDSLRKGYFSIDEIVNMTNIDPFFVEKIKKIITMEENLKKDLKTNFAKAKRMGFADETIARITGKKIDEIYRLREEDINITYKMVDTCSAEFEAKTPYYYSTYEKSCELVPSDKKKVLIVGSGPIRIGQGIEFDYCTVHAVMALKEENIETHIINNNPETVSTDYDTSDKLFFDPISVEDVINIIEKERYYGVMVQFGGQTSVNLVIPLKEEIERRRLDTKILGTSPEDINIAEDRDLFSAFLKRLNINQPKNGIAKSFENAKKVAKEVGYPVLVRPSYVLGGRAMEIVYDEEDLEKYMKEAVKVTREHPVLIDKFLENAIEIDVDLVSDGSDVLIGAIMEHIEEAGIHSGDSACVIPSQSLTKREIEEIERISREIALNLKIIGLLNIQMAIKDGEIYVLEANPRASRTIPFVSKATGIPLAKIAAKCMIGRNLREMGYLDKKGDIKRHVAVKEVVLPFDMLDEIDPVLSPEMKSTGEVMGIDYKLGLAFFKAELAANNELPINGTIFISVCDELKEKIVDLSKRLKDYGFSIITTRGTGEYLYEHGVETINVKKVNEGSPNILDMIERRDVSLIINILSSKRSRKDDYSIRKAAIGLKIPYITTVQAAKAAVDAIEILKYDKMAIKSLKEYISDF